LGISGSDSSLEKDILSTLLIFSNFTTLLWVREINQFGQSLNHRIKIKMLFELQDNMEQPTESNIPFGPLNIN